MTYLALARKWRPKRFDQIVGQPHVIQSLTHALTQNKIHHAYLFTGTHGIGKTTFARIFAKCLNCEKGISAIPCEQCSNCQEIDSGRFPDLYEIDAASRTKVEDTRELLDNIAYTPTKGKYKVYLIDEVHMLSNHSFNALLKTLEEPPEHVKFLLATTDPQKLPVTVLSRCLQFHLLKLTPDQIENQLIYILQSEKIIFEQNALKIIAQSANGSMRDSLSLLDQCLAYGQGEMKTIETQAMLGLSDPADIFSLLMAIHAQDAETALSLTQSWANKGIHFSRCLSELLTQLYQLSVLQSVDNINFNSSHPELKKNVNTFSREDVQLYYQIALVGQPDLLLAPTLQIGFEMIVMRMMTFTLKSPTTQPIKVEAKSSVTQHDNAHPISDPWNTVLQQLKLSGPTLAFAKHCSMHAFTNDVLHLTLKPNYAALNHVRHQQRIQEALMQQCGRSITVMITTEENSRETPAESAARLQEAQKQSAKKEIAADSSIQQIVKAFDAKIIEHSVESLKN